MAEAALTEKQAAILEFIRDGQIEHGIPPSTRDIQRKFRYGSQNAVMNHLRSLAKKGRIERINGRTWGLKAGHVAGSRFALPVYGTIPAGLPSMSEQVPDESIEFDPALFGLRRARQPHVWALRVSVRGAGMCGRVRTEKYASRWSVGVGNLSVTRSARGSAAAAYSAPLTHRC